MDIRIITQALYYISKKLNKKVDKIAAAKMIFFADRYHMRKYFRMITNDTYFVMKFGIVPSVTKDILSNELTEEEGKDYVDQFVIKLNDIYYNAVEEDKKLEFLSETDIEALDFVIENFGKHVDEPNSFNYWKNITHDYPEYKRFENTLSNTHKREKVVIEDFFSPETFETDPFQIIPQDVVELSKEFYFEG